MGKSRRLGKDWSRVNIWEEMSIAEYVDSIKDGFDDALGGNPLDSIIINSQLHRREKEKLARWRDEVTAQEVRVAVHLDTLKDAPDMGKDIMDSGFPHHSSSCTYPTRCQFYPICWESRFYADDPIASGYKYREPHHEIELEALNGRSN